MPKGKKGKRRSMRSEANLDDTSSPTTGSTVQHMKGSGVDEALASERGSLGREVVEMQHQTNSHRDPLNQKLDEALASERGSLGREVGGEMQHPTTSHRDPLSQKLDDVLEDRRGASGDVVDGYRSQVMSNSSFENILDKLCEQIGDMHSEINAKFSKSDKNLMLLGERMKMHEENVSQLVQNDCLDGTGPNPYRVASGGAVDIGLQSGVKQPLYIGRPDANDYRSGLVRDPLPSGQAHSNNFTSQAKPNLPFQSEYRRGHDKYEDTSVRIRSFVAKESDWFSYRSYFEAVANQAGWSDRTRSVKLMAALDGNLIGITTGMNGQFSYSELLAKLDSIHGIENAREDAALKLSSCKKGDNETVALYAERVRQLVERAYPSYSVRDKDEQALRVFLLGLPSRYDMRLKMRMVKFATLHDAVVYGSNLEHILHDEKQSGKDQLLGRAVKDDNELSKAIEKVSKDFEKIVDKKLSGFKEQMPRSEVRRSDSEGDRKTGEGLVQRRTMQNSPCFKCGEMGHWRNECPNTKSGGGLNYQVTPV